MKLFILEDEIDRYPRIQITQVLTKHQLVIAKSFPEAQKIYPMSGPYDGMLLDHDMEGYYEGPEHQNTGSEFVRWLTREYPIESSLKGPWAILHSQNPVGRKYMRDVLEGAKYTVLAEHPFSSHYVQVLRDLNEVGF